MVEAVDRTAVIDALRTAAVPMATFVFATTRASDMDGPLKTRCDEIQLRDYELAEVAEITRRQFPDWPNDVHSRLAVLGRRVPRISLELARSLHTEIVVNGDTRPTIEDHLSAVARSKRIDALGLTPADQHYLKILQQQRRAVGRETMLNLLSTVDRGRITEEIEPYLITLQFIRLTSGGREITREGLRYLESIRTEHAR
jgi:Holliday junction DNA helicase RuvB